METKKVKEFVDMGLGFPIRLRNVTMVKVRGIWTPFIKYNKLSDWALLSLSRIARPLTGSEVRFIRLHLGMTLQEFAKRFDVTHQAVMRWESKVGKPTAMNWSTEKDLRLFAQSRISTKPEKLGELYEELALSPEERQVASKPGLGPINVSSINSQLAAAK